MLEMIRAELFKASRKKRTWVMIALSSLGSPLLQFISAAFVASRVLGTVADQGTTIATTLEQIASPFNMARNTLAASSTLPFILLTVVAVFAVLLVGEERTFKMWKTILVANPDRMQVLAAKFATGMILLFFVIFGGLIGSLLFGGLAMLLGYSKGAGGNWLELLAIHGLQWLALAAPLMMGFLIARLNASRKAKLLTGPRFVTARFWATRTASGSIGSTRATATVVGGIVPSPGAGRAPR